MPIPKWPQSKTLEFITAYKSYVYLWNPSHNDYLDKPKRQAALEELARLFDSNKHTVERKIMDLQSQFSKEVGKMKNSLRTPEKRFVSRWFAFKELLFLLNRRLRHKWVDPVEEDVDQDFAEIISSIENRDNIEEVTVDAYDGVLGTEADVDAEDKAKGVSGDDKQWNENTFLNNHNTETYEVVVQEDGIQLSVETHATVEDDFTRFGQEVAVKLRKLKNQYAKTIVQRKINALLMKAELGKYDGESHFDDDEGD